MAVVCCADLLAPSVIWRSRRRSLLAPCQADLVFSTLAFDEDHCRHIIVIFDSYITKAAQHRHSCEFCALTSVCVCVCLCVFTQHVALSATLRRIGEEVSKPPTQFTLPQPEDPDLPKYCRSWPLYRSPCPHTRTLSTLIILRTVTQGNNTEHAYTVS